MVVGLAGYYLGDAWTSINYFLRASECQQEPMEISTIVEGIDFKELIISIMELLDAPNSQLILTNKEPDWKPKFYETYFSKLYPTKIRWSGNSNIICYQFDARCNADLKSCTKQEVGAIQAHLESLQFRVVDVGHFTPLAKIVDYLASSALYVGLDSGVTWVAASVGVPIALIMNDMRGNAINSMFDRKVVFYHRTSDFIEHEGFLADYEKNVGKIITQEIDSQWIHLL